MKNTISDNYKIKNGTKLSKNTAYQHTMPSARRFLIDFVKHAPIKIASIQVDGGSEFMAEFEDACAEMNIPLIVLPPKKPQYNGGVERGNRSDLLEDSVRGMRAALSKALVKYNTYRPHRNLKGLTPMAYIQTIFPENSILSHSI